MKKNYKKEFAVKILNRIKQIQATYRILRNNGVDLLEYENGVNLLEESIALLFTDNEDSLEKALSDVQWWIYEDVKKIITMKDKKINVELPGDFINWLEEFYKTK